MRRLALLLAATALIAAAPQVSFNDIEDEVMCTSCGVALNIAESPQADRERAEIRRLIASGLDKGQIKDRLVETYGPNVLAEPRSGGFNTAAYVVPIALVLALLGGAAYLLPRWRRSARGRAATASADAAAAGPALDPADARRLDEDLARYDP
jgi:cytochrome c-type biogenesis protein CcmH/NrfF